MLLALVGLACAPPPHPLDQSWLDVDPPVPLVDLTLRRAGGMLDERALIGVWTVVAVGYTGCPDVCPTTLAQLARTIDTLAAEGIAIRGLFVAVDPVRDEPVLDAYTRGFHPDIVGVTGDPAALDHTMQLLGASFTIHPPDGDGPVRVDHATALFVVDPAGRLAGLALRSDAERLVPDLRRFVEGWVAPVVWRDGWVRRPPPGAQVTAGYGTLVNQTAGTLTVTGLRGFGVPWVEAHETVRAGGQASMRRADLTLPPGGSVGLAPGGRHLMIGGRPEGELSLLLTFAEGGGAWVRGPVR